MERMDDFIKRMENNYKCSEFFRQKMRETIQRAFQIENDYATKIMILNRIEETYARHSENKKSLDDIKGKFNEFKEELSVRSMSEETNNSSPSNTRFDLSLD